MCAAASLYPGSYAGSTVLAGTWGWTLHPVHCKLAWGLAPGEGWPEFDTGGAWGEEVRGQVAVNTVFHDALRPSHVLLPVMP